MDVLNLITDWNHKLQAFIYLNVPYLVYRYGVQYLVAPIFYKIKKDYLKNKTK